ncbi:hypothetical protein BDZ97DRAFT_1858357 [Flammula alnicola]|nr:hypothetical protein BDZ97DRAFT_1858357 [Flammula alnicola]
MTNTPTPLFLRCLPSSIFPVFQILCPLFLLPSSVYKSTWHNCASQNWPDPYLNIRQGRRLEHPQFIILLPLSDITADGRTWWRCEHLREAWLQILLAGANPDTFQVLQSSGIRPGKYILGTPRSLVSTYCHLNPSSSPGIRVSIPQSIECTKNTDGGGAIGVQSNLP